MANALSSLAVKFDLYNNGGEGNNSVGLFTTGAVPSVPSLSLTPSHVDLHNGHVIKAHLTYDGVNLSFTLTDQVTSATFTHTYPISIPQTVGNDTSFAGFTGGTGTSSSTQEILSWSYEATTPTHKVDTPVIPPSGVSINATQIVSIGEGTQGATIYYTVDDTQPTAGSTKFTMPFSVGPDTVVNAIAVLAKYADSATSSETYPGVTTSILHPSGGFSPTGVSLNQGAKIVGGALQPTDLSEGESRTAWSKAPVPVNSFTTDFDFQITEPEGDGFTFAIQTLGQTKAGRAGGGLGYEGITNSVALKFDLHDNSGEEIKSTSLIHTQSISQKPWALTERMSDSPEAPEDLPRFRRYSPGPTSTNRDLYGILILHELQSHIYECKRRSCSDQIRRILSCSLPNRLGFRVPLGQPVTRHG